MQKTAARTARGTNGCDCLKGAESLPEKGHDRLRDGFGLWQRKLSELVGRRRQLPLPKSEPVGQRFGTRSCLNRRKLKLSEPSEAA